MTSKLATCHLLHGFRVGDGGEHTVDTLLPYLGLRGLPVSQIDYGRFSFARVRLCNDCVAWTASAYVNDGDVLIGHSNGGLLAWKVAEACEDRGCKLGLVLINPAIDRDRRLPTNVLWADVYHNPHDTAVWLAKFMPGHQWGSMGRDGHNLNDPRVRNVNTFSAAPEHAVRGHSDIFAPDKVDFWGPYIAREIAQHMEDQRCAA